MPQNTIEHPTWTETEYERLNRRENCVTIVTQLVVAFAIFILLLFALASIHDIAGRVMKRNAPPPTPEPITGSSPVQKSPMYDLERYFESFKGAADHGVEFEVVPCPDGIPGCAVMHYAPVKRSEVSR